MGTIKGYLIIGTKGGVKHYFLPTIKTWTLNFNKISLADINENKKEIDMKDYPMMDPEYSHEAITISGNTDY